MIDSSYQGRGLAPVGEVEGDSPLKKRANAGCHLGGGVIRIDRASSNGAWVLWQGYRIFTPREGGFESHMRYYPSKPERWTDKLAVMQ